MLAPSVLGALLAITLVMALWGPGERARAAGAAGPDAGASAGPPKLKITSFSTDRVLRSSGPSAVSPSCRRGFRLLGIRFDIIAVSPTPTSSSATQPDVALLSLVPKAKGTTATFQNLRAPGVVPTIRATADCVKISGKFPRAASAGDGDAGSAKKSRPVKLETYVAKEKKKVTGGGAGASATKSLKVACERPNSIPSDIGFDAKNAAEFAGARFVKRKGDIGAKGTFRTEGKDKLKLFLVCQQGKRVKMKGKVQKGTLSAIAGSSSAGAPPAQQSASKPRIIVRYGLLRPALSPGIPFPGLDSLIDDEARTYWTPPVPVSLPAGIHWVGRVLLDSAAVPRRASPETAGDDDDDDEELAA